MKNGRIIFIFVVSIIAVGLIVFSLNSKGYEKVGRVNEYVLYYDESIDDGTEYSGYILKQGFYEITVIDAISNKEINQEYIDIIHDLIVIFESQSFD